MNKKKIRMTKFRIFCILQGKCKQSDVNLGISIRNLHLERLKNIYYKMPLFLGEKCYFMQTKIVHISNSKF